MAKAEPLTAAGRLASVEDDVGALAAELQLDPLQVAGRALHDPPAHRRRAGERDLAHVGVVGQPLPCRVAVAGHDVDDAGREADLDHQLGQAERRQRGQLARLEHDRVPGGQGRAHLPAAEHQREVPRHDLPDHAEGLAADVVQEAGLDRDDVALELVGHAAEVAEAARGPGDVEGARVLDRVAGVRALERGQLGGVGVDGVGQSEQKAPALGGRRAPPRRECVRRRRHRPVDVGGTGLGDLRQDRAVVGVEHLDGRPVDPVDELPPDQQLVLERHVDPVRPAPPAHRSDARGIADCSCVKRRCMRTSVGRFGGRGRRRRTGGVAGPGRLRGFRRRGFGAVRAVLGRRGGSGPG